MSDTLGYIGLAAAAALAMAPVVNDLETVTENLGDAICFIMGWNGQADTFAERYDFPDEAEQDDR